MLCPEVPGLVDILLFCKGKMFMHYGGCLENAVLMQNSVFEA